MFNIEQRKEATNLSPKTIPQMKFESSVFRITPKEELPSRRGRTGVFKSLSFYPELLKAFEGIKKEGVAPFEDAVTIDLSRVSAKDRTMLKQKNPTLSFYIHLRGLVKTLGIQNIIEVRRIGQQIHIIGA